MTPESLQPRRGFLAGWNAFWFTPRDVTPLALIRVLAGMVTLYTLVVYGFTLEAFHGENAYYGAAIRREAFRDRAVMVPSLLGSESPAPPPANDFEKNYFEAYKKKWGQAPLAPYPVNQAQVDFADNFRKLHGIDFRAQGLPFPENAAQEQYLFAYLLRHRLPPPGPYPSTQEEREAIEAYMARHEGTDPRRLYARGIGFFSIFVDVTDPFWMRTVHAVFIGAAVCLLLGLGTRVVTPLTWFANLCYIHRNPTVLFGVDTMMNILLLYLSLGPSGAALSLDALLRRWWRRRTHPDAADEPPPPSVAANVAIRLMQVHLCIIYFMSGVSKLQGGSWWNGTAVWLVLANVEFAPMHSDFYRAALRLLGRYPVVYETFITGSCYLTLAFEIAYPFLIWRPRTRLLLLAGAMWLHGFIGLFMGLKTFSLMMVVFNLAFLTPQEVQWMVSWWTLRPRRANLRAAAVSMAPKAPAEAAS